MRDNDLTTQTLAANLVRRPSTFSRHSLALTSLCGATVSGPNVPLTTRHCPSAPLPFAFLIDSPSQLGFLVTHRKQTSAPISNRRSRPGMCNITFASPQKFFNRMKIQALEASEPKNQGSEGKHGRNTDATPFTRSVERTDQRDSRGFQSRSLFSLTFPRRLSDSVANLRPESDELRLGGLNGKRDARRVEQGVVDQAVFDCHFNA